MFSNLIAVLVFPLLIVKIYFTFFLFTGDIAFHGANKGYSSKTVSLSGEGNSTNPTENQFILFLKQIFSTIKHYLEKLFGLLF